MNPKIPAEVTWDVVERFFAAYTSGLHTGESTQLKELSTEDCKSCANLIEDIDNFKTQSIVATGGGFRFPLSEELKSSHEGRFVWRVEYTQAPITYEYPNPEDSHTTEPLSSVAYIELVRVGPNWRINGISASTEQE
ncbi:hypothetical protein ACTVCO_01460 [Sanguibacter sp. A247]|uniref:hypothetical protein n=1 Tax=unclassified Sanguibacter TaxID=2645534 RepID=UPI003FD6DBBE